MDKFSLEVSGYGGWDPVSDNLDAEVTLADGRRFTATFFTLENLRRLFDKNRATGECCRGTYLWAANMIIVEQLS